MSSGNLYGNGLIPFKNDEENVDDIDCFNDETFGDGAVEDDWEADHQQFADLSLSANKIEQDILNASSRSTSSKLFEEDLDFDRSADHLTKGVERLLLASEFDQDEIDPAIVSLRKQAHPPPLANLPPNPATRLPLTLDNIFGNDVGMGRTDDIFSKLTKTTLFGEPLLSKYSNNNLSQPQQSLPQQQQRQFLNNNTTTTTKLPSPKLDVQFEDEAIVTAVRNIPPELNMKPQLPPQLIKAEDLEKDLRSSSSLSMSTSNSNLSMNLEHHGNTGNLPTSKHILNELLSKQQKRPPQQQPPNNAEHMLPSNGSHFMPPPPPGVPPPHIMMEMNPGFFAPNFIFPPRGMMAPPPNHPAHHHHQVRSGGPPPPGAVFTPAQAARAAQMMSNFRLRGIPPPHMHPSHMHGGNHHPFHPNMMTSPHHIPFVRIPPPAMMHQQQRQMQMMGPGQLHPEHRKFLQSRLRYGDYHGNSPHRNMQHRRGGMGWMRSADHDPFANLMTQKEKDWVIRIQMMALQSDRPEIDDYYYQNYIDRRLKEGGYSSDGPQRLITPTNPNTDGKKYIPVQFTNSLGKLTTSSVYNPRQILELTEEEIPENEGPESRQNLSKRLVIYKTIEKVYDILIVVEEKIRASKCDHLDQRGIPLFGPHVKEINDHVDELVELCLSCDFDLLSFDAHDDQVFQLMKIRKGRKLIKRIIPYLTQEQRNFVLQSITAHIANMVKRDAKDKILVEMYTMLVDIIVNLQANNMLIIVSPLTCFALATALRDRVGASLIFKLVVCGSLLFGITANDDNNNVQDCDMQSRWTKFVADVTEIVITIATQKTQRHNTAAIRLMHNDDDVTQIMGILQARSSRDDQVIEKSLMRVIACK